jgi:hypothetical protein
MLALLRDLLRSPMNWLLALRRWGFDTDSEARVLDRLSRLRADALRDLVTGAYRFVTAKT